MQLYHDHCKYSYNVYLFLYHHRPLSLSLSLSLSDDPRLAKIRSDRGYTYTDVVNVCPDKLPNFEDKIKSFYKEHIHYGEHDLLRLFLRFFLVFNFSEF